tara:strand:- start:156 stop:515 length:360 start_codon:yes stop_codon:yes gene_type:complete
MTTTRDDNMKDDVIVRWMHRTAPECFEEFEHIDQRTWMTEPSMGDWIRGQKSLVWESVFTDKSTYIDFMAYAISEDLIILSEARVNIRWRMNKMTDKIIVIISNDEEGWEWTHTDIDAS